MNGETPDEATPADPLGAAEFQQQGQDAGLGDDEITPDEASGATPQDSAEGGEPG